MKDGVVRRLVTTSQGYSSGMVLTSSLLGCLRRPFLLLPVVTLPIAGLMARRAFVDDRDRRRTARRIELKRMSNRYLDEVGFVVHKDSRDAVKRIHRQLREHYSERAERLERTLGQAEGAAEQARRRSAAGERACRPDETIDRTAEAVQRVKPAAERLIAAAPAGGVMSATLLTRPRPSCSRPPSRSWGRRTACASPSFATASTRHCASPSPARSRRASRRCSNALVGEKVAPTDAGECTKVVTWYRNSHVYRVTGVPWDGAAGGTAVPAHRGRAGGRPRRVRGRRLAVRRRRVADRATARHDAHRHPRAGVDLRRHLDAFGQRYLASDEQGPGEADAVIYLLRHLHPDRPVVPRGVQGQHHDPRRVGELDRRHLPSRRDRIVADERHGVGREGGRAVPRRPARPLALPGGRAGRRADRPGRGHAARGRGAGPARHRRRSTPSAAPTSCCPPSGS